VTARPAPIRRGDEGLTLVELLLALAIMGILFVVVFAGMATFIKSTVVQRATVDLDQQIRAYSERLLSLPYQPCADGSTYNGAGAGQVAPPAGYSVTLTVNEWFDKDAFTCTHLPATDGGVQQITIEMTRDAGAYKQQVVLAKRQG
jgi:prepilin-type N-terminal cleavage/methylation domain-containing protein